MINPISDGYLCQTIPSIPDSQRGAPPNRERREDTAREAYPTLFLPGEPRFAAWGSWRYPRPVRPGSQVNEARTCFVAVVTARVPVQKTVQTIEREVVLTRA